MFVQFVLVFFKFLLRQKFMDVACFIAHKNNIFDLSCDTEQELHKPIDFHSSAVLQYVLYRNRSSV